MNRPLCFIDTETTSLRDDRELWEIAIVRVDGQGSVMTATVMVEVDDLPNADQRALQVGRFWERHPQGIAIVRGVNVVAEDELVPKEDAARMVASMTHQAEMWAAIPSFDVDGLTRLLHDYGLIPTWSHRVRCVETLVVGHLKRPVNGLAEACELMKVENNAPHTALGDAQAAYDVFQAVMNR